MSDTGHEAVMAAHDFYNHHSTVQAAAAELGYDWLAEAAGAAALPDGPLTVADYGVAAGHNSMRPMRLVIGALRQRTPAPISVVHTDLPANDFSSVFEALEHDPDSYLRGEAEVFPYAIGRSFYQRLFPAASVQLGWSSTTTHWLSRVPTLDGDSIAPNLTTPDVRAHFAEQAADDWTGFLRARSQELAPGGRMVMVQPCAHDDGRLGDEGLQGAMDEILASMVTEGVLTAKQVAGMRLPLWMRTPAEYAGPIDDTPHLRIVRTRTVEHPPNPMEQALDSTGDAEAFADDHTGATRAWSESMLFGSDELRPVADEFYRRYRAMAAADPDRFRLHVWNTVLEIERTEAP